MVCIFVQTLSQDWDGWSWSEKTLPALGSQGHLCGSTDGVTPDTNERWAQTISEVSPEPASGSPPHPGHPRALRLLGVNDLGSFSPAPLLAREVTSW